MDSVSAADAVAVASVNTSCINTLFSAARVHSSSVANKVSVIVQAVQGIHSAVFALDI